MANMFTTRIYPKQFDMLIQGVLNPKLLQQAIITATNKSARQSFTAASKDIRQEYALKAKQVKRYSRITPMRRAGKKYASISMTGMRIPAIGLKAKQFKKGVKVKYKKGAAPLIPGAFIAKSKKTGKQHVYKRTANERYPIKRIPGLSVADLMRRPRTLRVVDKYVAQHGPRILGDRYRFLVMKALRKARRQRI